MENHLMKFTEYSMSFGGGGLPSTQASKHRDQVSYLLSAGTEAIDSPEFLLVLSGVIDRKLNKEWQPNTVKAYLNSLKLFMWFINRMTLLGIEGFHYDVNMLNALDEQCGAWMRSLSKD